MKTILKPISTFIRAIVRMVAGTPPKAPYVSANCTNINMLLMHLCDFDRERYNYVLRWLAYPLRNPGAKMCYGLAVNAIEGTGVSLFFQDVAVALHQGAARSIDINRFRDHHNSQWAGAPLLLVDGARQQFASFIKSTMTTDVITVRGPGKVFRVMPNNMNFVFVSSVPDCFTGSDNRRFMVLDTPPPRERVLYQAVATEIKDGGVEAFRHFLMHGIDLGGFNETTIPPTYHASISPDFDGRVTNVKVQPA